MHHDDFVSPISEDLPHCGRKRLSGYTFFRAIRCAPSGMLVIVLLFLVSFQAAGQVSSVGDSIRHLLDKAEQLRPSDPHSATALATSARQSAAQAGLVYQEALANRLLSRIYAETGDYAPAVDAGLKALRIFQDLDNHRQVCSMYIILGVIYRYQHHYKQSLDFYGQAEQVATTHQLDTLKAAIWGNMGNVYYDMKAYNDALTYHQKSLEIDRSLNNRQGMGNTFHNIGMVYRSNGNLAAALDYYERSLAIDKEEGNKRNMVISYMDFTELFMEMKDFPKALSYANEALAMVDETGFSRLKPKTLSYLSIIHSALGNYPLALRYFKSYHHLTDSLHSGALQEQIAEMQTKYETEQKEKELALQNLQIANQKSSLGQQRLLIGVLGTTMLLLALVGYLLFNRYKLNQRNRQLRLENEQLVLAENLQERKEIDQTINYFATSLFGKNTVDEILWDVAKNCIHRLGLVDCVIYMVDEQRNVLVQKAAFGEKNPEGFVIHQPLEIPLGRGIVGTVAQSGVAEIVSDTGSDPRYIVDDEARASEIAVPLLQQDKVIGVIDSEHHEKDFFKTQHLEALKTIAAICSSKISQTQAHIEAERARVLQLEAEQIKKLDVMKSRFFANISHEFRTPLNLILAPLKAGRDMIPRHEIEMMRRNARRLLRLVNQLLDLAKIEVGLMKPDQRNMEISRFVKGIADSFSPLAEAKDIAYQVVIPEIDHVVSFDPDKLEKIVYNLLSNAFKFTPRGGSIAISLVVDQQSFTVHVSDTGIGIPVHLKDEIFKRFYQVDASLTRGYEGTGIGLSLTKELVDLFGGTIQVDSEEHKGCSFTVCLPYKKPSAQAVEVDDVEGYISDPFHYFHDSGPENADGDALEADFIEDLPLVLFVEDNADLRAFVRARLSDKFNFIEAANGLEGLALARQKVPDLVITDIMMPEMDGVELTKGLRSDELTSHIPIILLTARDDGETRIKGFETGAEQYLTKPFDIDELQVRISGLLALRDRLRQKFGREVTLQPKQVVIHDRDAVFLEKLMSIIEQHMVDGAFTVEGLQKEIGMSRMQLHRKLKALTGQSASEFIRDVKLKKAAQILTQPGVQVAEAAYLSGFSHLSYFSKCFREQYGMSPSAYAEKATTQAKEN